MTVTAVVPIVKTQFELKNGNLLFIQSATNAIKVTPLLCFPWMKNDEFISIRDENDHEVYLIKNLSELDEVSFKAVAESLLVVSFMMKIITINEIKEEFEIRSWTVMTQQGAYKFQTQIDYWPQVFNETTILIRDVSGNIFYIDDPRTLDNKSLHLLWPYLD